MTTFLRFLCLLFAVSLGACTHHENHFSTDPHNPPWAHLELGAGNYGEDGHTKTSLRKTVLKELTFISESPNRVDILPERDLFPYEPRIQFALLFRTLDQLVSQKGPVGIFHVNDLIPEYADYATKHLVAYAQEQGYTNMIIEAVPGDYLAIRPEQTLAKFGLSLYDSVHLKNPELSFYNYGMDGEMLLSSVESRQKARTKLQQLANLSKKGLYFFTLDSEDEFIPRLEKEEFICKGRFYVPTTAWEPAPYYFPNGAVVGPEYGRVYFIERTPLP